jgi:RNA polymerase sigma-70 factor (ECF subfamily)
MLNLLPFHQFGSSGLLTSSEKQVANLEAAAWLFDGLLESSIPDQPLTATALLQAWGRGDQCALDELAPIVQGELQRLARRYMGREAVGHTLQTTALVNEVFVRLIDGTQVEWRNRAHFFAIAARMMRRILVDTARARRYQKRGGGAPVVSLDEALTVSPERSREIVALDEALEALAKVDARKSQVVELRYFGGLTVEETAAALDVSPDTVMRDWRLARGWLLRALKDEQSPT